MVDIFKLIGTIAVNNKEANEGIDETTNKAESAGSKISSAFSKIGRATVAVGKVVATGIAATATAIAGLSKTAIDNYAQYEQLVGGTELLFAEASDFIMKKADRAYKNVQMSQNDYLQQVNGFATGLKTALNGDTQAAAELADKIITAEADIVAATGNSREAVQNAFNGIMKSNFTMLDNLQLGIKPTKEGFQEVIDKVNEWNEANGRATEYQIDNLADCQSALVDYIEMQGLAGYAANEAAGTISGSISMMKAAWSNFITGMADPNQDFDALIGNLVDSVVTAADNLIPRIVELLPRLVAGLSQLVQSIAPHIPVIISELLPALISGAGVLLSELVNSLPEILGAILPGVGEELGTMFSTLLSALSEAGEKVFPVILDFLSMVLPPLSQIVSALLPPLLSLLTPILDLLPPMIQLFRPILDMVVAIVEPISNLLQNLLPPIVIILTGLIQTVFPPLQAAFEGISNVVEVCMTILGGLIDFITGVFTGNWEKAWGGIVDIFKGIFNLIPTIVENVINGAISIINGIISGINYITGAIGIPAIPDIPNVQLPRLEKGGVLEEGQVGLLEGNGAEAVVPLDQNDKWISAVAADMDAALGGNGANEIREMKELFSAFVDNLPEMLIDAFKEMKIEFNNREVARMVKAVN